MSQEKYISIISYTKHQHYHDRSMVWFKWRSDCLQSIDFMTLSPTQRWLFIGLICLATKSQNCIKYDISFLSNVLKIRSLEKNCLALIDRGMIEICYKDSSAIREDKIRKEKERDKIREDITKSLSNESKD